MKILLFGNNGQVGQEIEELAKTKNIDVFGFDIDNVDITNSEEVNNIFGKSPNINIVINAAAYTAVDKAEDEPEKAYAVNCLGVKNIALACKKYAIPLLHISTDYVFSGSSKTPYKETDETGPSGVYGQTKLDGEKVLQEILEQHIILRVSWVFGKHGQNFVKTILRLAKEREELSIVGDQFGCPTAAEDIARVLLELSEKIHLGQKNWGIYNYCNYPAVSWYDFAIKIVELGKNKHSLAIKRINKITTKEYPTKAKRPLNSELLVGKIVDDYGVYRENWQIYLKKVIELLQ